MAEIKYFEGDFWILDGTKWTNLSSKTKTAKDREYYLKGMIRENMKRDGRTYIDPRDMSREYNDLMMDSVYGNNVEIKDINTDIILTKNKIVNLNTGTIEMTVPHAVPFTPYQIQIELPMPSPVFGATEGQPAPVEHKDVTLAKRFMNELTQGDKDMQQLLFEIIGTSMSPRNESIFPVFYSPHKSSGKGTIMDIIGNLNGLTREIKGEKWWNEGNNFSLSSIRNQLVGWIDEVPATLPKASTEKIKSYSDDKKYLEIERKGIDQERMLNTTTFIATTNHRTELYSVDDSIKGRMMWIEFGMNLYGKPKFTKHEIETIKNSKEALAWFANEGIKAYLEVLNRPGTRKERYTQVKSDVNFWTGVSDQSIATEIIESSEELSLLWDAKETFIPNETLKQALDNWKIRNKDSKITIKGFKIEVITHIHANKLGVAELGRNTTGTKRGIKVVWSSAATQGDYIVNHFGDKVSRAEWDKIMDEQEQESKQTEELYRNEGK